jgi:riboflavin kinase / FMN adenylyltransferase
VVLVWRAIEDVPTDLPKSVVTIGNFDGIHRGHQHVFARCREVASARGLDHVIAVTFDPHPMAVLRPEHAPSMLTTMSTRLELLEQIGVDGVLVLPFSLEMASWSPEDFVGRVLVDSLHVGAVVIGANFRFGHRASGDVSTLTELGEKCGFDTEPILLDGGPQVWSSTYVRHCLIAGDVEGAEEALGRPFSVRGIVIQGEQRGRTLGFPTANVPIGSGLAAPADGVYAGWLRPASASQLLPAAISVGTNPTFEGERQRRVEAYVIDTEPLDLYGQEVEISFVTRLRGMIRFDGVDGLIEAMNDDVRRSREILGV